MAEAVQVKSTADLLNAVYKQVKSASDLILNLMPKVRDEQLKSDMTVQLSAFEAYASRALKFLADEGAKPEDEGTLAKMSAKWNSMMNTMLDSTTSRLAQILIEDATERSTELTRELREAENRGVSENSLRLIRDVCMFDERIIREMKEYL